MKLLYVSLLLLISISSPSLSQYVVPDYSFSGDGMVTVATPGYQCSPLDMLLQPDGKMVVGGIRSIVPVNNEPKMLLCRINTDGSFDATFGNDGIVFTDFEGFSAFALQTDGKIVTTGNEYSGNNSDILLFRYHADGSLDASFGVNGLVVTEIGNPSWADAFDVVIQNDGKIVVSGTSSTFTGDDQFTVLRYNTNGTPDSTFGGDGIVKPDFTDLYTPAIGVAIDTDGKIIVLCVIDHRNFALARLLPDGSVDSSFSQDGFLIGDITPFWDILVQVLIQPDGKYILGGFNKKEFGYEQLSQMMLCRFNSNGDFDSTFNGNGIVITNLPSSTEEGITDLVLLPDGRILAAGYATIINGEYYKIALLLYNQDGSLDMSFDGDGVFYESLGLNSPARCLEVQPDGKILVATGVEDPVTFQNSLTVLRYIPDAPTAIINFDISKPGLYPNFTNDKTVLKYELTATDQVKVSLHDMSGKIFPELINEVKTTGAYTEEISLALYPPGIYLLQIDLGKETAFLKLVKF